MYYYDVLMRGTKGPNPVLTYSCEFRLVPGQVVSAPLSKRKVAGLVLKGVAKPKFKTRTITPVDGVIIPKTSRQMIDWLAQYYGVSQSVALRLIMPAAWPQVKNLTEPSKAKGRGLSDLVLNKSQTTAVNSVLNGRASTFLLHGETASGKTLVYRQLVKATLAAGKSAVVLVPEIALTPQVVADFSDLSEQVFISHSGLSLSQRQQLWLYCLQQKKPLVLIGPRSTLFYPLSEIGLIVVDEAHEQSYKQEQSPRYQAQTVAAKLVQLHGGKLVLGSATPRISDYWQAQTRSAPILTLPRHKPANVAVEVINQTEADKFNRSRIISDSLLSNLGAVLKSGGQSLLYINRRGTATMAICADCGWMPICPRCGVPASLHHDEATLLCHQCGWRSGIPINCPVCGSSELIYRGAGTKAVEREVARLLPSAKVARFDSDNPKNLSFSQLYPDIYQRKLDIIIGTQSLAVGLDLPNLDLVGVVSADSELYLPDFAASERAFQLLYQVIGRAGRRDGGKVVIQTHNPNHPSIYHAIKRDYASFYDGEIEQRKLHNYPPFGFLLQGVVEASSPSKAESAAKRMTADLTSRFGLKQIIGPAPAFYAKHGGRWRYTLVLKSKQRTRLVEASAYLAEQTGWRSNIDPVNLLV